MKSLLVADLSQLDSPQTTRESRLSKAEANEQTWQSSEEARARSQAKQALQAKDKRAGGAPPQKSTRLARMMMGMREWGEIKRKILLY